MRYSIELVNELVESHTLHEDLSKRLAVKLAKIAARKFNRCKIYVSWGRESDGQNGFLNSGGNHDITGKAW